MNKADDEAIAKVDALLASLEEPPKSDDSTPPPSGSGGIERIEELLGFDLDDDAEDMLTNLTLMIRPVSSVHMVEMNLIDAVDAMIEHDIEKSEHIRELWRRIDKDHDAHDTTHDKLRTTHIELTTTQDERDISLEQLRAQRDLLLKVEEDRNKHIAGGVYETELYARLNEFAKHPAFKDQYIQWCQFLHRHSYLKSGRKLSVPKVREVARHVIAAIIRSTGRADSTIRVDFKKAKPGWPRDGTMRNKLGFTALTLQEFESVEIKAPEIDMRDYLERLLKDDQTLKQWFADQIEWLDVRIDLLGENRY